MLIALLVLSIVVFGVVRIHGDPALLFLPPDSTEQDYQRVRRNLGLDRPVYAQYGLFLSGAVRGNFGNSIYTGRPVLSSIKEAFPNSFWLVLVSMITGLALSIPLGVLAAANKGKTIDTFARMAAALGQSLPSFWVALIAMQLFAVYLGILPTSGTGSWRHYVLPVGCLTFFIMPGPVRLVRSSMLEVLDTEYIRFARVKGLPKRVILWKHALRNSLLPVLGFSAVQLAFMITGAVVIETVYAWPGLGRLAFRAISSQDFPMIQGVVLVTAFVVILANLVADIFYALVDPRIRLKA